MGKVGGRVAVFYREGAIGTAGPLILFFFRGVLFIIYCMIPHKKLQFACLESWKKTR